MALLLGVDVGTTGTKSLLIQDDGKIIASAYCAYPYASPAPGRVEQDPEDWWRAVVQTVRECVSHCGDASQIKAMSLSTQGATLVCTDEKGCPILPAIVWMDTRAARQGEELAQKFGQDFFYRKTGWKVANCFNLLQILWLRQNDAQAFARTEKFLSTMEYIHCKLTGKFVMDQTNAGITQLYNITQQCWDTELLALCGVAKERLPQVQPTGSVVGTLTAKCAAELGIPQTIQVVAGAHDQYCAAIGTGVLQAGEVLLSCGTSWCITSLRDSAVYDESSYIAVARHPVDGVWAQFAYTPTGGAAMEWVRREIAVPQPAQELASLREIDAGAAAVSPGSDGVLFLPHFSGMLYPVYAANAHANLCGLQLRHTRSHILRAVMEGAVYDMKYILQAMGAPPGKLKALGGATKSKLWMQMAADILGCQILVPTFADVPVLGAAIVAGVGCGVFPNYEIGYSICQQVSTTILPNPENSAIYEKAYQNYRQMLSAIHRRELYES